MLAENLQKALQAASDTLRKAERVKADADAAVAQARATHESIAAKIEALELAALEEATR